MVDQGRDGLRVSLSLEGDTWDGGEEVFGKESFHILTAGGVMGEGEGAARLKSEFLARGISWVGLKASV